MVLLENVSGKPEDRFVNTFHFQAGDDPGQIVGALRNFYNAGSGGGIAQFLSSNISRTSGACRIKVYDLADPKPRAPIMDDGLDLTASSGTANLPNELAACMSFYGTRNLPRQRGRVYLGPFATLALEQASGNAADELISGTVCSYVIAAGASLINSVDTHWVVHSPTGNADHLVTAGWIDKAWDIQRRRGAVSQVRFTFTGS